MKNTTEYNLLMGLLNALYDYQAARENFSEHVMEVSKELCVSRKSLRTVLTALSLEKIDDLIKNTEEVYKLANHLK